MYITKTEVKAFIGETNTDNDDLIDELIARVEALVENDKCERHLGSSVFTEFYDGDGSEKLLLDNYPIISVTSVHDDDDRVYGVDTLIDADDIVSYDEEGILLYDNGTFTVGHKNIKVVYQAGLDPIPNDLKHALIQYVAAQFIIAKTEVNAFRPTGDGSGESEDKPTKLMKEADKVFQKYRRIR